uniref:protein-tyrosine-phosphatase n=1 Tax=Clastoptera arizonana TaxID=38151 RepID=A0A1B6C0R8_9HEMI
MSNKSYLLDSPMFSILDSNPSPMTELANNLGTANLGTTSVRRKLTLSINEESPCQLGDSPMVVEPTGDSSSRLLKNALKFSQNSNTPIGPGGMKRGIPRRLHQFSDDENQPPPNSMMCSPIKASPSKFAAVRQLSSTRPRQPLDDQDPNSQDSGFGFSEDSKSNSSNFRFAEPSGLAPRRVTESPRSNRYLNNIFHSSSSNESLDDGFTDFILPLQDEEAMLPPGMGGLIAAPILNRNLNSSNVEERPRSTFRRCVSENLVGLGVTSDILGNAKRSAVENPINSPQPKKHKPLSSDSENKTPHRGTLFAYGFKKTPSPPQVNEKPKLLHSVSLNMPDVQRPKLKHSMSESEAIIKNALSRSCQEELIGDFSLPYALPLISGAHQDLKCISPDTVAKLVNGEFNNTIGSYEIIDCRYPYEYEGGHIIGAKNIYTKDQLIKEFMEKSVKVDGNDKRNILIFHCEFSSERGPTLSRFLRSRDRHANEYPTLTYPEMYLLNGGYKAFFNSHKDLCEPSAYRPMLEANREELQHFRIKSKTWSGDNKVRPTKRTTSFMRLGL